MGKHKIGFIIAANSGGKRVQKQKTELINYLKTRQDVALEVLDDAQLIQKIVPTWANANYEAVYACGGDGTLNLVSGELVGTETAMGIVPLGSGNGYARHQKIPLKWNEALKSMDAPSVSLRDTGIINGVHFLNLAGVGYSARISRDFQNTKGRGLRGYLKTIGKNLKLGAFETQVSNAEGNWNGKAFMVDFCNGSQWGNNIMVAPGNRDNDGTLTAVIFKKINPAQIPVIGFRLATNTASNSIQIYRIDGSQFVMQFDGEQPLHVDGDYIGLAKEKVDIQVLSRTLKLWKPA